MTIKAYLIQTGILALVFFAVFYSIRLYTFNEVRKQYNQTIERLELEQLQNLQQLQSQQNIVVSGYLQKIKTLEGEHEKTLQELETAQFSNTVTGVNCVVSNAIHDSLHKDSNGKQQCRQPEINPILSVTPEPNFSERLQKVWLLQKKPTN
jgi:hypothetical protein